MVVIAINNNQYNKNKHHNSINNGINKNSCKKSANYEYNSYGDSTSEVLFNMDEYMKWFRQQWNIEDIRHWLTEPMVYNKEIRDVSRFLYNSNGTYSSIVDNMVALPCLDKVLISKCTDIDKGNRNKKRFNKALNLIKHKEFIRDVLFNDLVDGVSFYYFNTAQQSSISKSLNDMTVQNIAELNDETYNSNFNKPFNIAYFQLPTDYCKIVGRRNNRYIVAFNLQYFSEKFYTEEQKKLLLQTFPAEIVNKYQEYSTGTSEQWITLNEKKVFVHKNKSTIYEVWGRPLVCGALFDILFNEELKNAKRVAISDTKNRIFYQTFPEGTNKGMCALSERQQKIQHNNVRDAIQGKNARNSTSFFSVACGTKIESLPTEIGILDEDIEPKLNDDIATDMGFALGLLNGASGSYSSQQNNIELVFSRVYKLVSEIAEELSYIINSNIVMDSNDYINLYYLPTTLINRKNFVNNMKDLYMNTGGSRTFYIASTGVDVDMYMNVLDNEKQMDWENKYPPHATSYNTSMSNNDTTVGRPEVDDSTNESTLQGKTNGSNSQPRVSK